MGSVLAVGAGGKAAGLVVPALAERGARVRALLRRPDPEVLRRGASEVVLGDLRDADSVRDALHGVDAAFYIAPAFIDDEAEVGRRFVAAAVEAGVRRIVFSSVIHPVISGLVNHAAKAPVEEAILDSGLEYTFLHPALFFQMLAPGFADVLARGVLAEPWSAETAFSRVDYRDVAEVAATALTDDSLLWGTFELASETPRDRHEVARVITEVTGVAVEAQRVDTTGRDVPAPLKAMFDHYEHVGLKGSSVTLEACLGRAPRTLRDYITQLASASTS